MTFDLRTPILYPIRWTLELHLIHLNMANTTESTQLRYCYTVVPYRHFLAVMLIAGWKTRQLYQNEMVLCCNRTLT